LAGLAYSRLKTGFLSNPILVTLLNYPKCVFLDMFYGVQFPKINALLLQKPKNVNKYEKLQWHPQSKTAYDAEQFNRLTVTMNIYILFYFIPKSLAL